MTDLKQMLARHAVDPMTEEQYYARVEAMVKRHAVDITDCPSEHAATCVLAHLKEFAELTAQWQVSELLRG